MTTVAPKWKDAYEAAEHGDFEAVRSFVEKGEDVLSSTNDEGKSIAIIAAQKNDFTILKYALETENLLLLQSDHSGNNIMQYAIDNNALDVVKYLVDHHKWDVHYKNRPSLGNTPIHHATKKKKFKILKYFIEEKEGDVNVRNDLDDPPVFLAAEKAYFEILTYLVEKHKADLTLTNSHNENILFGATRGGHLHVIQYVLEERKVPLDVNWVDNAQRTILYLAVSHKYPRIIKYLVELKGADVNMADDSKVTPLHMAADYDDYATCRYLVEHGANAKAKDKYGFTPLQNANDDQLVLYFQQEVAHERTRRNVVPFVPGVEGESARRLGANSSLTFLGESNRQNLLTENIIDSTHKFIDFLTAADMIVRYIVGFGVYRGRTHDAPLSPPEILRTRMDPVAIEAVLFSLDE